MEKKRQYHVPRRIALNRIFTILVVLANLFAIYVLRQSFGNKVIGAKYGVIAIVSAILVDYLFYKIIDNFTEQIRKQRRVAKH